MAAHDGPDPRVTILQIAQLCRVLVALPRPAVRIALGAIAERMEGREESLSELEIARLTGMSRRHVQRGIPPLERGSVLARSKGNHARHEEDRFLLILPDDPAPALPPARAGPGQRKSRATWARPIAEGWRLLFRRIPPAGDRWNTKPRGDTPVIPKSPTRRRNRSRLQLTRNDTGVSILSPRRTKKNLRAVPATWTVHVWRYRDVPSSGALRQEGAEDVG